MGICAVEGDLCCKFMCAGPGSLCLPPNSDCKKFGFTSTGATSQCTNDGECCTSPPKPNNWPKHFSWPPYEKWPLNYIFPKCYKIPENYTWPISWKEIPRDTYINAKKSDAPPSPLSSPSSSGIPPSEITENGIPCSEASPLPPAAETQASEITTTISTSDPPRSGSCENADDSCFINFAGGGSTPLARPAPQLTAEFSTLPPKEVLPTPPKPPLPPEAPSPDSLHSPAPKVPPPFPTIPPLTPPTPHTPPMPPTPVTPTTPPVITVPTVPTAPPPPTISHPDKLPDTTLPPPATTETPHNIVPPQAAPPKPPPQPPPALPFTTTTTTTTTTPTTTPTTTTTTTLPVTPTTTTTTLPITPTTTTTTLPITPTTTTTTTTTTTAISTITTSTTKAPAPNLTAPKVPEYPPKVPPVPAKLPGSVTPEVKPPPHPKPLIIPLTTTVKPPVPSPKFLARPPPSHSKPDSVPLSIKPLYSPTTKPPLKLGTKASLPTSDSSHLTKANRPPAAKAPSAVKISPDNPARKPTTTPTPSDKPTSLPTQALPTSYKLPPPVDSYNGSTYDNPNKVPTYPMKHRGKVKGKKNVSI